MVLEKCRYLHRGVVVLGLVAGSLALAGCTTQRAASGVVDAVGAEVQYGDVISQIGGPFVSVTSIMSNPTTDPHNFEASPRVAREISSARLIVQNGAGYDAFMNQLESASPSSTRTVVTVSTITDHVAAINPHLWYQPTTMPLVARDVTDALVKDAPQHAAYFRARDAAFMVQWDRVDAAIAVARERFRGLAVATTEPVADYLLSAMGLVNLTPWRFQADVMNGIDPSPQDIVTQQDLIARHGVRALCFNAQVSSPVTVALRDMAAADHVATVAVYETMPTGLHVQSWMLAEITAIEGALAHATSTGSIA